MFSIINKSTFFKTILATTTTLTLLATTEASAARGARHHISPEVIQRAKTEMDALLISNGLAPTGQQTPAELVRSLGGLNYTPEQLAMLPEIGQMIRSELRQAEAEIAAMPDGADKQEAMAYLQELKQAGKETFTQLRARYPEQFEGGHNHHAHEHRLQQLQVAQESAETRGGVAHFTQALTEISNGGKADHTAVLKLYEAQKADMGHGSGLVATHRIINMFEALEDINIDEDTLASLQLIDLSKASDDATVASLNADQKAALLAADILQSASSSDPKKNTIQKITSQVVQTTKHNTIALAAAVNHVVTRLSAVKMADSGLGASAGDGKNDTARGAWITGVFGNSTQKGQGVNAGYKGRLLGATAGVDIPVNDEIVLGLAYSNITSKLNYKQFRSGDKTTARTHVFSVYGQFDNDEIVWTNIASLSNGRVSNKQGRTSTSASSKIKSVGVGLETNIGYKIEQSNITFLPNLGIRYTGSKDGAYKETGAGVHNMEFGARSNHSLSGIVGLNIMTSYKASEGIELIPGAHASIENNFVKKAPSIKFRYAFTPDYVTATNGDKVPAVSYNAGVSLLAKASNFEVGAAYNFNGMKKYSSHEGSLKLKVLF